jgi:hypothetical protein
MRNLQLSLVDLSILRHSGIWRAVDEAELKKVQKNPKLTPPPAREGSTKKSLKRLEKKSSWVLLFRHQAPQFQIPVLADHQSYQPPPIPPLPLLDGGGHMSAPPPRPPLPQEVVNGPPPPPRPPMPDTDDEEGLFSSEPGSNRPIHMAAHGLYQEVKQV